MTSPRYYGSKYNSNSAARITAIFMALIGIGVCIYCCYAMHTVRKQILAKQYGHIVAGEVDSLNYLSNVTELNVKYVDDFGATRYLIWQFSASKEEKEAMIGQKVDVIVLGDTGVLPHMNVGYSGLVIGFIISGLLFVGGVLAFVFLQRRVFKERRKRESGVE